MTIDRVVVGRRRRRALPPVLTPRGFLDWLGPSARNMLGLDFTSDGGGDGDGDA